MDWEKKFAFSHLAKSGQRSKVTFFFSLFFFCRIMSRTFIVMIDHFIIIIIIIFTPFKEFAFN